MLSRIGVGVFTAMIVAVVLTLSGIMASQQRLALLWVSLFRWASEPQVKPKPISSRPRRSACQVPLSTHSCH